MVSVQLCFFINKELPRSGIGDAHHFSFLCCVFMFYLSSSCVLCAQWCECLWIVHSLLPLKCFIMLADWSNSPRVDIMSFHSDTLSWFRTNKYFFLLIKAVWFVEKKEIPSVYSLVWPDRGSESMSYHTRSEQHIHCTMLRCCELWAPWWIVYRRCF